VAIAAGLSRYPITEYEPKKIKWLLLETEMPKEQVAKMLQQLLLKELPKTSIARWMVLRFVTFLIQRSGGNQKLYWLGRFVKQNEERVKKIVFSVHFFYDR
jgi:hypothetical protein